MSTEAQINANRRNAQKSTGPRTSEGKAVASQNSLKHGLSARKDVIGSESQAEYDQYRERILGELNPISPMETMLAERIVSLSWRLVRIGRIQNLTIDALNENKSSPLAKLTQSLLPKVKGQTNDSALSNDQPNLGRMAIKDFSNARVLDRLLMYERRIENSLYRTILELQRLNIMRNVSQSKAVDENEGQELERMIRANFAKQSVRQDKLVQSSRYQSAQDIADKSCPAKVSRPAGM
jgi:hypothetical protein